MPLRKLEEGTHIEQLLLQLSAIRSMNRCNLALSSTVRSLEERDAVRPTILLLPLQRLRLRRGAGERKANAHQGTLLRDSAPVDIAILELIRGEACAELYSRSHDKRGEITVHYRLCLPCFTTICVLGPGCAAGLHCIKVRWLHVGRPPVFGAGPESPTPGKGYPIQAMSANSLAKFSRHFHNFEHLRVCALARITLASAIKMPGC